MTSSAERDALVTQYTDYARSLVLELYHSLPQFLERNELISAGLAGLVEAAHRFDAKRGVHFKTFAYYRVRGAVMDFVRKSASLDAHHRAKMSGLAAVDDIVESQLAERPSNVTDAPADYAVDLARVLDAAASAFTVSECAAALHSESAETDDPSELASRREEASALRTAIEALPEKERFMLQAVYFEGRTIEQAGKTMGLSKSWASRLHARALQLTRDALPDSP